MRISELARTSGVPVATIKYYLREGILPAGEARGATQAEYDDEHARRLRLIRSLADLAGLPIARIKDVLALIDHPAADLLETLGRAIEALPPYPAQGERAAEAEHPLAKAALERLGWAHDEDFAANAQLERALVAVADAGIPLTDDRLLAYGAALHRLAEFDLARMPAPGTNARVPGASGETSADVSGRVPGASGETSPDVSGRVPGASGETSPDVSGRAAESSGSALESASASASASASGSGIREVHAGSGGAGEQAPAETASAAIEYAVLGTALYEPVVVALRRLAHQDVASRMLHGGVDEDPAPHPR